ncbi:hypothetical protein [Pyrobaculum sp.]|uniref:hypothetical protein n=1 Tax=Pyrobaculum sp. TaxID=2004705 RepID=UPI003D0963FF
MMCPAAALGGGTRGDGGACGGCPLSPLPGSRASPLPEPHQTPASRLPRLLILTAALDSRIQRLEVKVVNPGREAALAADVRVANVSCVFQPVDIQPGGERVVEAVCGHVEAKPGTLLPGELATSEGVRHPFTVLVNGSVPG